MDTHNFVIEVANSEELIASTFDLFFQLRPHLEREAFTHQVRHMQTQHAYSIVTVLVNQRPVAAAGYRITQSLAWGKYLYVDDLIVDEKLRRNGYAQVLWDWLVVQAENHACQQIHLDSAVHRHDAHKFYLRNGMDSTCHHFQVSVK